GVARRQRRGRGRPRLRGGGEHRGHADGLCERNGSACGSSGVMPEGVKGAVNLPNLLSALRLVATPFAICLILEEKGAVALLLFVGAAVTDWLDGYIARRMKSESPLGALLDPIADKVFGVGVLWALVHVGD